MNFFERVKIVFGVFAGCIILMAAVNIARYNLPGLFKRGAEFVAAAVAKDDIPGQLKDLAKRNPEAEDFVKSYPEEKDKDHIIDLSVELRLAKEGKVPALIQWDKRWGYKTYSEDFAALSACGPVVLSMAAIYVFEDATYDPVYMMDFATENGYSTAGSGSLHSLIYDGGEKLGLEIKEIDIADSPSYLLAGDPVICLMGPGDFTSTGHFIILTGYTLPQDGGEALISLNDPNSMERTGTRYTFSQITKQTKQCWRVIKYPL